MASLTPEYIRAEVAAMHDTDYWRERVARMHHLQVFAIFRKEQERKEQVRRAQAKRQREKEVQDPPGSGDSDLRLF